MISSSKRMGEYEKELLNAIGQYFEQKGFKVHTHVQLNISWGNIISDVDLVVEGENQLFGIEVKSKRDNLGKLVSQINRMFDYFDGVYVATDNPKWMSRKELSDERIGILIINGLQIAEKACKFGPHKPDALVMAHLRKICLIKLSAMVCRKTTGDKKDLIEAILKNTPPEHLQKILKSIIMCNKQCKENCPLWIVEKQWITPIKNVQAIVEKYRADLRTLPLLQADFNENDPHKEPSRETDRTNKYGEKAD
jgi:hypothetical protein